MQFAGTEEIAYVCKTNLHTQPHIILLPILSKKSESKFFTPTQ